jgi:hypothetical protein
VDLTVSARVVVCSRWLRGGHFKEMDDWVSYVYDVCWESAFNVCRVVHDCLWLYTKSSVFVQAAVTPHPATMCQSTCPGTQISTTPFLTSLQERCAGRICNSRLLIALQQESQTQRKIAVANVSCLCSACENQN